jgi:phenylpropionate dioxygenase-like ring-hydroxylating dioxygenase large terminal subunit
LPALYNSADLKSGQVVEVSHGEEDLLLWRDSDGNCHAVTAYCPHQRNYLPNGLPPGQELDALLREGELCCPYHGWRFNTEGQWAGFPVLRRWHVREHEGQIQIGPEIPRKPKSSA